MIAMMDVTVTDLKAAAISSCFPANRPFYSIRVPSVEVSLRQWGIWKQLSQMVVLLERIVNCMALLLRVVCGYIFYIGGLKNIARGHIKNLVEKSIGSCKLMKIKNFDKILKSTNKLLFNRLSHPSSRTVEGCYQRLIDGLGV